ncbi:proton channel OTOP3-like [Brienomyrus brachyistius]|uniref:proton channel OTOP3-like n=1 Tax=Brienomyrus brachyistius TaxID=42636 RepID=UPI0020B1FAAD|nr:proton channel OTOP3-like [Brienomyrus brachyistius]
MDEVMSPGEDVQCDVEMVTRSDPDPEVDSEPESVPGGRRLFSGLLGLNVIMLGAALMAADAFYANGQLQEGRQVFILLLLLLSVVWMLWYLLWSRKRPGRTPHTDHHAGGITVAVVLVIFSAFSLFLHIFRMGYFIMMRDCKPLAEVLVPFAEAPFLALQTYLLWAHSKDCIHKHKILTRSGLMFLLSTNILLWLNAVTEDTVHMEIELEKQKQAIANGSLTENITEGLEYDLAEFPKCQCTEHTPCLVFRKGFEILYPFNIEFYLMAGCMIYVMWKNVGRRVGKAPHEHHQHHDVMRIIRQEGILLGPLAGLLVLAMGAVVFILYQVWVSDSRREDAFLVFYGYHLALIPAMSLFSLAGMITYRVESRLHEASHNPTRSLDVRLLVAAAVGQLALSYFSLVAAMAIGSRDHLGSLDLSYNLFSLLELLLQNIFIIEGLHRHPNLSRTRTKGRLATIMFKKKKGAAETPAVNEPGGDALLKRGPTAPPAGVKVNNTNKRTKRVIQEICAFLILGNVMLWVIPAFGAHPQFENGLGKQFYGFQAWFIFVNLGQPLVVFYRMHSVRALMGLLISA